MPSPDQDAARSDASKGEVRGALAVVAGTAFAVICCAAAPLALAALAGASLAPILGIGAGLVALAALVAGVILVRRRRSCEAAPTAISARDHPSGAE